VHTLFTLFEYSPKLLQKAFDEYLHFVRALVAINCDNSHEYQFRFAQLSISPNRNTSSMLSTAPCVARECQTTINSLRYVSIVRQNETRPTAPTLSELQIVFEPPLAGRPVQAQLTFISAVALNWDLMFDVHEYYERQHINARFIIVNPNVNVMDYVKQGRNVVWPVSEDDVIKRVTIEDTFDDLQRDTQMMYIHSSVLYIFGI